MSNHLNVKFWGVRGSVPVPGPDTVKYGGNTPCIEIRTEKEHLVFDAGTGIRPLGEKLMKEEEDHIDLTILITHTHWDHIQGFPFFTPIFVPENEFHLIGPDQLHNDRGADEENSFRELMENQMRFSFFPVSLGEVENRAQIEYSPVGEETLSVGECEIQTQSVNHTVYTLGYRLTVGDRVVVYTGDNEPYHNPLRKELAADSENQDRIRKVDEQVEAMREKFINFCSGADLLIADAQYTEEEYQDKIGWGHSSMTHTAKLAAAAEAERVVFFHHEPTRDDREMEKVEEETLAYLEEISGGGVEGVFAREGMEFELETES